MRWRLSQYCLVLDGVAGPDKVVVHDLLTDTGVLVDRRVVDDPDAAVEKGEPEAVELMKAGLVFDAEKEPSKDRLMADYWLGKRRLGPASAFFTYVLTLHCNLKCTYCYQAHLHQKSRMTKETAVAAADWSVRVAQANRVTEFIAIFFGGEPLLEPEALLLISRRLQAAAAANGWTYRASAVTNGTLLTPALAAALADAGVQALQVTLDGPPALHDQRRVDAAGGGTFERILKGIEACRGLLQITVRVNVDRQNLDETTAFLETLARFKADGLISNVDLAGVMDPENQIPHCQQFALGESDYQQAMDTLYQRAQSLGMPPMTRILPGPCPAVCDGSWVVDPDGELFRCHHLMGRPEWSCGNVRNPDGTAGEPNRLHQRFVTVDPRGQECSSCPYMPTCFGGCRYRAIVQGKDLDEPSCYRQDYDRSFPTFLKTFYRDLLNRKGVAD